MRVAEVIGKVTLSQWHPSLEGATWKMVTPLSRAGLNDNTQGRGEPFAIYDELAAGENSLVLIADGAEASAPFHPNQKPIDGYNAAILDTISVQPEKS
jgi:ethanolamine utilization protein EutN